MLSNDVNLVPSCDATIRPSHEPQRGAQTTTDAVAIRLRQTGREGRRKRFGYLSWLLLWLFTWPSILVAQPSDPSAKAPPPRRRTKTTAKPQPAPKDSTSTSAPRMDDEATNVVRWSTAIAPLIVERCIRCHGEDATRANLNLNSGEGWDRGGDNGPLAEAGDAQNSLLIGKLQGTADGQRMPLGGPPLSAAEIALISTWIAEGMKRDVNDARRTLRDIVTTDRLTQASEEDLNQERKQVAASYWRQAFPHTAMQSVESVHFLIIGNHDEATLRTFAEQAEAVWNQFDRTYQWSSRPTPLRGRATLYIVSKPYDLHEFAVMVENRSLATPMDTELWNATGTDAYLVVQMNERTKAKASPLPRGLAGLMIRRAGPSPLWFERGFADLVAARTTPDLPRAQRLNRLLPSIPQVLLHADDFQTGKTSIEMSDAASLSYVQYLMKQRTRGIRLLQSIGDGNGRSFDELVNAIWGLPAEQLVQQWWRDIGGAGEQVKKPK